MKRHVFFVLFFFFVRIEPKAQQSVIDNNTSLLSNLELKYKTPCIKFEASRFKVRRVKIDKIFINELNEIYYCDMKLKDMISFLEVKGYSVARKINESKGVNDTLFFEKVNEGYLNGHIKIIYDVKRENLISKSILLSTKTHFFCETKEWQSYSYIDFFYLRKLVKRIRIPFMIGSSNVELESK